MPTYEYQHQKTQEIREAVLPITLDQQSLEGKQRLVEALGVRSKDLTKWRRLPGCGLTFTFTSAKTGRLNSAWMTEERQKARRLEADNHAEQIATTGKAIDWRTKEYKEAFSGVARKKGMSGAAKQTLSRLSNEEVREFATKHAPPEAKKK
jgi:hypothetical protein